MQPLCSICRDQNQILLVASTKEASYFYLLLRAEPIYDGVSLNFCGQTGSALPLTLANQNVYLNFSAWYMKNMSII
jgi:hypothetical protein